ncbi:OX-2 membrane glycoprotein-like isoform X2 [Heptranchias perlo]
MKTTNKFLESFDDLQMKLIIFLLLAAVVDGKDVETEENVTAVLDGNVILSCTSKHLKDIIQVTWQKLNDQPGSNVATFSEMFGPSVFGPFSDRAAFVLSEMQVSTIALSGVRLEDEGCYQCRFDNFPVGSYTGKTCLIVLVIPDVQLDLYPIHISESSEGVVVATFYSTGKPAPKICCNVTSGVRGEFTESVIVNPNGTVTVTSNFTVVPAESDIGTELICVMNHSATNTEIVKTVTLKQY